MDAKQYQAVTDRIIAMLEVGTPPWSQSWGGGEGGRPIRLDGTPYRGVNVLNLWAAQMARGFTSRRWMTYKGAQSVGGNVKKGAKAELAFYVGTMTKEDPAGEEYNVSFMKCYPVFNADEIEGVTFDTTPIPVRNAGERIAEADEFISQAKIIYGGNRAFYRHAPADTIHLPEFEQFDSTEAFYGTALHELVHWSGAANRLDRTKGKFFGDSAYAMEELVAELGAAYLSADLAISATPREDHASYLASWLKALKEDNRAIFRAASFAEKACGYLHKGNEVESRTGNEAVLEPA